MFKRKLLISVFSIVILLGVLQLTPITKFIYDLPSTVKSELFSINLKPPIDDIILLNINNRTIREISQKIFKLKQKNFKLIAVDLSSYELAKEEIGMLLPLADSLNLLLAGNHSSLAKSAIIKSDVVSKFRNDPSSFELLLLQRLSKEQYSKLKNEKETLLINYSGNYTYFSKYDFDDSLSTHIDLENTTVILGDLGMITPLHPITSPNLSAEKSSLTTPINPDTAHPDMYQVEVSATIALSILEDSILKEYDWQGYILVAIIVTLNWFLLAFLFQKSTILFWVTAYALVSVESLIISYFIVYFFDFYKIVLDFRFAQLILLLGFLATFSVGVFKLKKTD